MTGFSGDLCVKLVKDDSQGLWDLLQPLSFTSAKFNRTFTAPAGFRTDFCSVPRIPLAYDILGDRARMSGTIHDWLYSSHVTTREEADEILREMLELDGINCLEAQQFFVAVRLGGQSHWGPDPVPAPAPIPKAA